VQATDRRRDLPLELSGDEDDEALLAAVLEHYQRRRAGLDVARRALASLGLSEELADALGIGLSDRTLGLRLPKRRSTAGDAVRDRLVALGIYRPSGHEHLVGCLVVPLRDATGATCGLVGLRLERTDEQLVAKGLSGGVFNAACIENRSGPLVVAALVAEALVVISTGIDALAPGRPGAFDAAELRRLARSGRELVLTADATRASRDASSTPEPSWHSS
jgi:hypothetical protein